MKLNNENYYSIEADKAFCSVSQYKNFFGTYERNGCETQALAIINGDFVKKKTKPMLIGSYVDSYFEGTLDKFKEETPDLFKKDGTLKAEYLHADTMIERCKRDKKFMQYMSGEKQVIMTAEIFGVQWKIKMDSYIPNKAIVDLKTVDDLYKVIYTKEGKMSFVQAKLYDFQLAIYQKVVEMNTGQRLPCYIAAVDKKEVPAIEIISLSQSELDGTLAGLDIGIKRIQTLKNGQAKPDKCGRCDYCKDTKIIQKPISIDDLLQGID